MPANWNINYRGVGVCLNGNVTKDSPSPEAIAAIAELLRTHYDGVGVSRILGHREIT